MGHKVTKTDEEWRTQLSPEQFRIAREGGTERAFTGAYYETKTPGVYRCVGCRSVLFTSKAKFDSGSGWPSFVKPADLETVTTHTDTSLGMSRTEVRCATCEAHLGHVFPDGPREAGGMRFCINSAVLELDEMPAEEVPD